MAAAINKPRRPTDDELLRVATLARIPENALKFAVGVLLCAFGAFWVGEGIGVAWPGADWSILALIAGFLAVALFTVPLCRGASNARVTQ